MVWADTVSELVYRSVWSIFHGPVGLGNIPISILWICIILGLIHWTGTMNDLKLIVGQCDLYFMVQCLLSYSITYTISLN